MKQKQNKESKNSETLVGFQVKPGEDRKKGLQNFLNYLKNQGIKLKN